MHTRVVETIVALFPPEQNRGIIRAIPNESRGYPLHIQMLGITDENGTPVYYEKYDTSQWDSNTESYVPFVEYYLGTDEYVEGRTTYVLEYSLESTINSVAAPDGGKVDEFFWDVNGTGWAQTFGEVTARIHLGPELQNALEGHTACYTGRYGADGTCDLHRIEDGYQVTVAPVYRVLDGHRGDRVPGRDGDRTHPAAGQLDRADRAQGDLRPDRGVHRDRVRSALHGLAQPRPGLIIAQYDPPEQDVLVSAEILGRGSRRAGALFIDFAVRGIIRIIDKGTGGRGPPRSGTGTSSSWSTPARRRRASSRSSRCCSARRPSPARP